MTKVLIVDDDRFARMGLMTTIPWDRYGMEVVGEAVNGRRAMEFLRENETDLVFADIAMPVMDGIELITAAKEEFPSLKFVVLSFHEDFEFVQEALRLGVLDYISKDRMDTEDTDEVMRRIMEKLHPETEEDRYGRFMVAAEYIRENYAEQLQASDVADRIGYSRSYFSVSFKKYLGVSFYEFLRKERIRSAKTLLLTTDLSQSEIASRVGYREPKYFRKAFFEVEGCSPLEYREQAGKTAADA